MTQVRAKRAWLAPVVVMAAALVSGGAGIAPAWTTSHPIGLHRAASSPRQGGSVVDLRPELTWPGLDPATNPQDTADASMMNAIYGQLFEAGPHGEVVPREATGYKFLDGGLTVEILLRPGQTFQDGTPFTATAVADSIRRDLIPSNACLCLPNFKDVTSVTAADPTTVVMHLSVPFYPIIEAFILAAPNWTVSPTALQREGETGFAQRPIGAGSFEVVTNIPSTKLVLRRFSGYWQRPRPYLDNLTFLSTGSDQSDYSALVTGEAQIAELVTTTQVVKKALTTPGLTVHVLPPVSYEFVALNEKTAPFNNILAREAVMYATNSKAIVKALYQNLYTPVEAPTASGDLFYEPKIPKLAIKP
jgi:peptide/nickel transport system substrate-binding protein